MTTVDELRAMLETLRTEQQQQQQNFAEQMSLARDRVVNLETTLQNLQQVNQMMVTERRETMDALRGLPEAIKKLADKGSERKALMDNRGLGKPYVLGDDDTDTKFRMWAIKMEDFVVGILGEKFREAMQWAAEQEYELTGWDDGAPGNRLSCAYGAEADANDELEHLNDWNSQLYSALRSMTEGTPFTYVDNAASGNGLEAWRALHAKYDPATGGRKKAMLNALIRPQRTTYEQLSGALERWKTLRTRYEQKKDQFGKRELLPQSIAMNALEQLVPADLEQHLLLNAARLKTFESYDLEIKSFVEAKHGGKVKITSYFTKDDGGARPMDIGSLITLVAGGSNVSAKDLAAFQKFQKGKGKGKETRTCKNCGKPGHLRADCRAPGGGANKASGGKGSHSQQGGGKGGGKGQPKTCDICGKTGHLKKDCWSKPNGGKGSGDKGGKGKGGKSKGKGKGKSAGSFEVDGNENQEWTETAENAEADGTWLASLDKVTKAKDNVKVKELGAVDAGNGWIKCNFDTGAADTAIPKTLATGTLGTSDVTYKTASGELVPGYGPGVLAGNDENGVGRKLGGEFTEVHKILASAAAVHSKGHFSLLEAGGGYVIPVGSKVGRELLDAYRKILAKHGCSELLPLWEENGVYNFYLKNVKATPKGADARQSSSSASGPAPMDVSAAEGSGSAPGESRRAPRR